MQKTIAQLIAGVRRELRALGELLPLGVTAILLTCLMITSGSALALFQSQISPVESPTATPTPAEPTIAPTTPPTGPTDTPTSPPSGPTPTPGPIEPTPTLVPTSLPPEAMPSPTTALPTATPVPTRPPRPTATPTPQPPLGNLGPETYLRIAVYTLGGAALLLVLFIIVWKRKPRTAPLPSAEATTDDEQKTDADN
ncbi:MAG: hypothetical protein H5T62_18190 [Anaerolineae bacterium]|nr:hypothetical protein [Anaerolineae bacterium]